MNASIADKLLPSKPTASLIEPSSLVIWLIAEPKWGKTAFFMNNPQCLLLAFEAGHKFQRGHKVVIDKWDQKGAGFKIWTDKEKVKHMTAMQAQRVLMASKRFDFVAIDTVDMATKMCADFFCETGRVEHISDLGDYGKGQDKGQNTPMRRFILSILKTGRGVGLISHSKIELLKFTSGEKARKECRLPGGVRYLCESQADIIMHGELGKKPAGERLRRRVVVCEGDMDTLAGNRTGAMLPERYIAKRGHQWSQFCRFFTDPKAADKAEAEYRKSATTGLRRK
jgi:hypothetical protein